MTIALHGTVALIAPSSSEIESGLVAKTTYTGMVAPQYYVATILIPNTQQKLQDGVIGTAKIFVRRRSLGGFAAESAYEFLRRKLW